MATMYADDIFRRELSALTAKLAAWADGLRDAGTFDIREGSGYWSLRARPATPGACPLSLVLRNDQKYDLALDDQRFEDRPIEHFSFFSALAQAVGEGRIERKILSTAATGEPLFLEIIVLMADGQRWSERRARANIPSLTGELVEDTLPYLPYRRA